MAPDGTNGGGLLAFFSLTTPESGFKTSGSVLVPLFYFFFIYFAVRFYSPNPLVFRKQTATRKKIICS